MNDEKRTSERVPVNLTTRWRGATGSHDGRVEDLSVAGCFVNTKGAVDVGEIVTLQFNFHPAVGYRCEGKSRFINK